MTTPRALKKLSAQHEAYCLHRVAGHMRSVAYRLAGFGGRCSDATLRKDASVLDRDPLIQARQAELWAAKFKALHMDVDEILGRVAMLARTDAADILDEDGCVDNVASLSKEASVQIAGLEIVEDFATVGKKRVKVGQKTKVRLRDPAPYLRLLAEHKKLVKAPEEGLNSLAGAIADRLKAARERRRKETP